MKNKSFLDKVIRSLLLQNFQVDSNAYTYGLVRGENDSFSGKIIDGIDITKGILTIAQIFGSPIDSDCADFKTVFKEDGFKKDLKALYSITVYNRCCALQIYNRPAFNCRGSKSRRFNA